MFVENAGFGGSAAAPIAGLIMDKYLSRQVSNKAMEKRMKEMNLMSKVVLTDQQRAMLKPDTTKKKTPVVANPVKR